MTKIYQIYVTAVGLLTVYGIFYLIYKGLTNGFLAVNFFNGILVGLFLIFVVVVIYRGITDIWS